MYDGSAEGQLTMFVLVAVGGNGGMVGASLGVMVKVGVSVSVEVAVGVAVAVAVAVAVGVLVTVGVSVAVGVHVGVLDGSSASGTPNKSPAVCTCEAAAVIQPNVPSFS